DARGADGAPAAGGAASRRAGGTAPPGSEPPSRNGSGRPARPPPVTRVTVPSGATSQSRPNQWSGSASALPCSSTSGKPRISTSSASGGLSQAKPNPAAPPRPTGGPPHQGPASTPADAT